MLLPITRKILRLRRSRKNDSIATTLKNLCHAGKGGWKTTVLAANPLSTYNEPVSDALDRNDFDRRIRFQVVAQLGDVDIQVAAVKEGITAPQQGEYLASFYNFFAVFIQKAKQLTFPVGEFALFIGGHQCLPLHVEFVSTDGYFVLIAG